MAKPFLKWAGGKTQLLPHLLAGAPLRIETYYEPFLGGGALFFALQARGRFQSAVLSDLNGEIVNVFEQVRDAPDDLIGQLDEYQKKYLGRREQRRADFFYEVRDAVPMFAVSVAARTIFLNKTCFNGLYRVNSAGQFNVPHGRYKAPTICDEPGIREASVALQGVKLEVADFQRAVCQTTTGDFVYFDPPYVPLSGTSNFTAYTSSAFDMTEQARLADISLHLKERGVAFRLSNSSHPDVVKLYEERGLTTRAVFAGRMINSNAAARGPIRELVIRPPSAWRRSRSPASTRARARRTSVATPPAHQARSRSRSRARKP